jgi:integrase
MTSMKSYRLVRRGSRYYAFDRQTRTRISLGTDDPTLARRLIDAKNDSARAPAFNLALGRAFLSAHDPEMPNRTWSQVMDRLGEGGRESTIQRCARARQDPALASLRSRRLVETTSSDFLRVLSSGGNSTNFFLRRIHNLALGLGWLPAPVLPPKMWPRTNPTLRRAISAAEHGRIQASEQNPERKLYYELLWLTGASQGDAAALLAENINWNTRVLLFQRRKLKANAPPSCISIGTQLEAVLRQLPQTGPLFPKIGALSVGHRAAEFYRRCRVAKVSGVSLHSYRYAWAERAFQAGIPERYAMANLGHSSPAVHRYYAKRATVVCPALDPVAPPKD